MAAQLIVHFAPRSPRRRSRDFVLRKRTVGGGGKPGRKREKLEASAGTLAHTCEERDDNQTQWHRSIIRRYTAVAAADSLAQWTVLADKLLRLGYEIAGSAGPEVRRNDDHGGDIRLMAVTLIARSLSNMRGTLVMVREKRIVEARVLARCILENQFWAAGFAEDPDKFRQAMINHDLNKRGSSGQILFATGEMPDEIEKKLRQWMRENKGWSQAKSIAPKQVAKDAQVSDAYVFYDLLSSDAHPTARALNRYVVSEHGEEITDIDLDPEPTADESAETVSLSCYGLVGVLVSACRVLQSDASPKVDSLAGEYLEMMRAQVEGDEVKRNA